MLELYNERRESPHKEDCPSIQNRELIKGNHRNFPLRKYLRYYSTKIILRQLPFEVKLIAKSVGLFYINIECRNNFGAAGDGRKMYSLHPNQKMFFTTLKKFFNLFLIAYFNKFIA